MASMKLNRRTILRGIGGSALALPALEAMQGSRAHAQGPSKRFVLVYGGISTGADNRPNLVVPEKTGPGYDLKRGLQPLGKGPLPANPGVGGMGLDVQKHVSIVSGLKVPWGDGKTNPPGGKSPEFHYNSFGPQLTGVRSLPTRNELPQGATADQVVADSLAKGTTHRVLAYRVQVAKYVGDNSTSGTPGRLSYRRDAMGKLVPVDPIFSPKLAFRTLFAGFAPPTSAEAKQVEFLLRRRKSVLDLLEGKTKTLMAKLGKADQRRLEQHLDSITTLERRLEAIAPMGGQCRAPADPGEDPPIEGAAREYQGAGGDGAGYSNEELRAQIFTQLIQTAFSCDLSRVASLRLTFTQSFMRMEKLTGHPDEMHQSGHQGRQIPYTDGFAWHVKHFAALVAALRDAREPDGSSLLDHTALVLLFEGGQGFDAESRTTGLKAHSTENMVALVAGHAGGLNKSGGQHIVKTGWHPAQALISAMAGVGVAQQSETLGEIKGRIPELFS